MMFCHIVRYFCVNVFDCFELPLLVNVLKFQLSFNFFLCKFQLYLLFFFAFIVFNNWEKFARKLWFFLLQFFTEYFIQSCILILFKENCFPRERKNKACKSPIIEKINECTSQIVSLFTHRTKPQQRLYKTDTEVLNNKRNMNGFWNQKLKTRKAVY